MLTSWFLNLGHLIDTLWYLAALLLKVLLKHVELPHVLDLLSTWSFFWLDESRGSFGDIFTISTFLPEHSFMLKSYQVGGVGGPSDFSVSPWSKFFYFPFSENFYSTSGPVWAWTWTLTRTWTGAWQFSILHGLKITYIFMNRFLQTFVKLRLSEPRVLPPRC